MIDARPCLILFDYAQVHGLALFPIPYGFKEDPGWKRANRDADPTLKPIVWRWSQECSKNRADWEAWHTQYRCNFGIAAAISGYVVFDLDVSKDPDVWAKFCTFWTARGIAPPTPQFQSARKGWHILVKVPEGFDLSTLKQSPLMDAVDTRVDGYIVAPGSYYDGTPNGEDSGHYQMVANAPPPHNRPDLFQVLTEVCGRKSNPKTTKFRSSSKFNGDDVDLSLLPPLDEVVARVQHAYDVGSVSLDSTTGKWTLNPAAHASNPDPADRARREANGYFANYAQWMPVVGAIKALYGESAKSGIYPLMDRGRDHKKMFGAAWASRPPTSDIAYAALKAFISASNALGFNDGGRYAKAKNDQVLQRLSSAIDGITGTTPSTAAIPMMGGTQTMCEQGIPIVEAFNRANACVAHATDAPALPLDMHAAPLRGPLTEAIGKMVTLADTQRAALKFDVIGDVLGVLAIAHEPTLAPVVARIRQTGAILADNRIKRAELAFEAQVNREVRVGQRLHPRPHRHLGHVGRRHDMGRARHGSRHQMGPSVRQDRDRCHLHRQLRRRHYGDEEQLVCRQRPLRAGDPCDRRRHRTAGKGSEGQRTFC